jgi:hypothetical protein
MFMNSPGERARLQRLLKQMDNPEGPRYPRYNHSGIAADVQSLKLYT